MCLFYLEKLFKDLRVQFNVKQSSKRSLVSSITFITPIKGRSLIWIKQLSLIFLNLVFAIIVLIGFACSKTMKEVRKEIKCESWYLKRPVLNLKKWLLFLSVSIENSICSQTSILNVNYGNHSLYNIQSNITCHPPAISTVFPINILVILS